MVQEGRTNQEVYSYVRENFGENQMAVPRQGWFDRISYGLPFLLIGLITIVALGFAWKWSPEDSPDDEDPPESGDDEKRERIEQLAADGGPLG